MRATISAEAADVVVVTSTGEPGGLGATMNAWTETYGDSIAPQRGIQFDVPPFETTLVEPDYADPSTITEIEALVNAGISADDAMATVCSWLPIYAAQQGSFYLNPSPDGPIALRVQTWELPTSGLQATVMLYEEGPEDSANVSQIMMTMEETGGNNTSQSAGGTPEAPVATPAS